VQEGELNMDPVTLAIIAALSAVSNETTKKSYNALKTALEQKFKTKSQLLHALDLLEQRPISAARQAVLAEEVASSGVGRDPELVQIANTLIEQLKEISGGKLNINRTVEIRGDPEKDAFMGGEDPSGPGDGRPV
jgi:hypothetical protein